MGATGWVLLILFFSLIAVLAWALLRIGAKADEYQEQQMREWEKFNRRNICHN